jgi:hypothetical protein
MPAPLTQEIEWLLVEAEVDDISLHPITHAAYDARDADPSLSRMDRTLAVLGTLIDLGVLAVDLVEDGPCKPWPDQRRAAILGRIEREWRENDGWGYLGAIYGIHLPPDRR